jgi:drug/metabolite transporter (DMT)-like permease
MMNRTSAIAVLAAAITGILVGTGMVATRFVVDQVPPASLALLRYAIALACLLPPMLWAGRGSPIRRPDLLPIAVLGMLQFGVLIALLNYGLQYIPSGRGALIFATAPLLTMLLAAFLGQEPLSGNKTAGVVACGIGVALVLSERGGFATSGRDAWIGDLAVGLSALTSAICNVGYRPYMQRYPTLKVSVFSIFAAVLLLAAMAGGEDFYAQPPEVTGIGWLAIVFIGLSSAIGFYTWLWALGHMSATRAAIFLSLGPVTATAGGAWLLGETVSLLFLSGLILVVAGIWFANRAPAGANG